MANLIKYIPKTYKGHYKNTSTIKLGRESQSPTSLLVASPLVTGSSP